MSGDEDEFDYSVAGNVKEDTDKQDVRPQWMRQLLEASRHWLSILPKDLTLMKRTSENIKDPLYRFFEREVNYGARLLSAVRLDLTDVTHICEGTKKQTNAHRTLTASLIKGLIPKNWAGYSVPAGITVIQWVQDFSERIQQLHAVTEAVKGTDSVKGLKQLHVWLGGLFSPEAYITATRQYVAQANAWALEELVLEVNVADTFKQLNMDDCSFAVKGMRLMGAAPAGGRALKLTDTIYGNMEAVQLRWAHQPNAQPISATDVRLPVYLYADRKELLFTLNFDSGNGAQPASYYERGVAIICGVNFA